MTRAIIVNLSFFVILWILIFLFEYLFVMKKRIKGKSKKKNVDQVMEFIYLIGRFKLDKNKVVYNKMAKWCSIINGFIISAVVTVISNIDLYIVWQLLIGFVLLFALIYSLYEIYGRHLAKKWGLKNE